MADDRTDVDFVRLVPDDQLEYGDDPFLSDLGDMEPIGAVLEPVSLDFVELYAENYEHFVKLAAVLDPEEPDELIDRAFLAIARLPEPPVSRSVALLEVRNELPLQAQGGLFHRRRELIVLPESDDPIIDGLERLPAFQRDCLVLHHFGAMLPEEIADVWNTDADRVSDTLDFAEATLDASEDADSSAVGERIRRAINAELVDFEGEPDVAGFEAALSRKSRKPLWIALGGVAAAAVLIIGIALWQASPAGDPIIGPTPDREVAERTTSTKAPTSTTRAPSVITVPPNARTPGSTTATTRRGGTATTRRGQPGGGAAAGPSGNPGPDPTPGPGPGPGPTDPPPTQPPPTDPPPTTQPPPPPPPPTPFTAAKVGCSGLGSVTCTFTGTAEPGTVVTISPGGGTGTANAAGNWSASTTFNAPLFGSVPVTISSSQGSANTSVNCTLAICS